MSSNPSTGVFNPKEFREKQIMARAGLLKQTCGYLPDFAFKARKAFFIAKVRRVNSTCFTGLAQLELAGSFPKVF